MVGPLPGNPFAREVIVDAGDHYATGRFTWLPPRVTFAPARRAKNHRRSEIAPATATARPIRDFLVWSRFPYWTVEKTPAGTRVGAADMRFPDAEGVRGATFSGSTILPP